MKDEDEVQWSEMDERGRNARVIETSLCPRNGWPEWVETGSKGSEE